MCDFYVIEISELSKENMMVIHPDMPSKTFLIFKIDLRNISGVNFGLKGKTKPTLYFLECITYQI